MEENATCCFSNLSSDLVITCFIAIFTVIFVRVLYVFYRTGKPLNKRAPHQSLSTLIVLGSGGHTAEMINLLLVLQKDRFTPRFYIAAATDNMSLQKARVLENSLADSQHNGVKGNSAEFMQIYRSREVGQSYVTSVWTTLVAIAHALWLMIKIRPQVVLCNGPGLLLVREISGQSISAYRLGFYSLIFLVFTSCLGCFTALLRIKFGRKISGRRMLAIDTLVSGMICFLMMKLVLVVVSSRSSALLHRRVGSATVLHMYIWRRSFEKIMTLDLPSLIREVEEF